jgi:hypothetical protein
MKWLSNLSVSIFKWHCMQWLYYSLVQFHQNWGHFVCLPNSNGQTSVCTNIKQLGNIYHTLYFLFKHVSSSRFPLPSVMFCTGQFDTVMFCPGQFCTKLICWYRAETSAYSSSDQGYPCSQWLKRWNRYNRNWASYHWIVSCTSNVGPPCQ